MHNEPTVLVVDDSPTVRKIVQMTLQREHIRVITASDGLSALTSVADEMPQLSSLISNFLVWMGTIFAR